MTDDREPEDMTARWHSLPPRTPLEDLVAGQEIQPKPQVIADPSSAEVDEATRYPI